jgi:hypothetical protein
MATDKQREVARKLLEEDLQDFGGYICLDEDCERTVHVTVRCTAKEFMEFCDQLIKGFPEFTDELLPCDDNNFWGWTVEDICENLFELHPEQAAKLYPEAL